MWISLRFEVIVLVYSGFVLQAQFTDFESNLQP